MHDIALLRDISSLKSVDHRKRPLYLKLMGERVVDALWHLPSNILIREKISQLHPNLTNKIATLIAKVVYHDAPTARGSRRPYRIVCDYNNQELELLFFHSRRPYLERIAPEGKEILISGKLEYNNKYGENQWKITHPDHIGYPSNLSDWVGIEPIYPLTAGMTQSLVREIIKEGLQTLSPLPEWIDKELLISKNWPSWHEAIQLVHSPQSSIDLDPSHHLSRQRLAYDEILAHQLSLHLTQKENLKLPSPSLPGNGTLKEKLLKNLPFTLTKSQEEAILEVYNDLKRPQQMLRLLQGDVGSGKTLVAIMAALQVIESGYQAAVLAPTDILSRQHYRTMQRWLEPIGVKIAILTGREKGKIREKILKDLALGDIDLLVGTHAIIQDSVDFFRLGLTIIDEQHRFGVEQRVALSSKGYNPHILSMTATPIPRTLMLANYGDMDVSVLREKPPGRQSIITRVIPVERLDEIVEALSRALATEQKIYWVCPLIEESSNSDFAAVKERFEHLSKLFPGKVAFVHGKLKSLEKEQAMESFINGNAQILIATTVIEVGVDVAAATIMVVEHAERFGLAQLHQLRGRVGRGSKPSTCLLLYAKPLTWVAHKRLETMRATDDGFIIAKADLRLRGGGEILGTRQSGALKFRFLDFSNKEESILDLYEELLEVANKDARRICREDPTLESERGQAIRLLLRLFKHDDAFKYKRAG
jgi:ATP-dependent DNA helicase RecG